MKITCIETKMKQAIIRAIDHFCTTILESSIEEGCCHGEDFFGASVSIFENECEQIWYLFFTKETLIDIARNLLFEENYLSLSKMGYDICMGLLGCGRLS